MKREEDGPTGRIETGEVKKQFKEQHQSL